MSDPGTPTLDQLRVFLTVVEVGSFAATARRLGRANSVISYSISNLEAQLGVSLFDRDTTKKPQLTEAGLAVLAEARVVERGISGLRAKVKGLLQGLESEVHLALDVMLPAARTVDALKAFQDEFPTVTLRLYVEALGAVTQMVLNRTATLGVSGPLDLATDGLERIGIGSVPMAPVAAPSHPLALAGRNAPGADSLPRMSAMARTRSASRTCLPVYERKAAALSRRSTLGMSARRRRSSNASPRTPTTIGRIG